MGTFAKAIRPYVDHELDRAAAAQALGDAPLEFAHLERAHVLGQASTVHHVRVHQQMLSWAWREGNWRECLGQILRVVGAATKTAIGLVPSGNTGGSNVSPFKSLPISEELSTVIRQARSRAK